uniref:surface glycoprotein n=1 Tax=Halorubrum halophilum TaxID=413816 RepID=UPI00186B3CE6
MTNDNNTRTKANAVFFSLIMVVSMVAVGFAAAPAAAVESGDSVSVDDISLSDDDPAASGVTYTIDFSVTGNANANVNASYVSVSNSDIDLSGVTASDVTAPGGAPTVNSVSANQVILNLTSPNNATFADGTTQTVTIDGLTNPTGFGTSSSITVGLHNDDGSGSPVTSGSGQITNSSSFSTAASSSTRTAGED